MATRGSSTDRLDFRLPAETKELITRAANHLGLTVSAFAVSRLTAEAQNVIDNYTTLRLSDRARGKFLAMLDADSPPNEHLRWAAKRHKRSIIK